MLNMARYRRESGHFSPKVGRKAGTFVPKLANIGAWGQRLGVQLPPAPIISPARLQAAIFTPPRGPTAGDALRSYYWYLVRLLLCALFLNLTKLLTLLAPLVYHVAAAVVQWPLMMMLARPIS